jgi:peptidoglycan/xylan/chitin deacetylase (PgdA/CDA1 family)
METQFEYGSRVGIWRMLDLFEKHKMPVTGYIVAKAFERNSEVAAAFSQNGHEVGQSSKS